MFVLLLILHLFGLSESTCGDTDWFDYDNIFGLKTKSSGGGSTDGVIFVNVNIDGSWVGWERPGLDNSCDDYEGGWDTFDAFENAVGDVWYGMAFYNCGNDGWRLEGIRYRDSTVTGGYGFYEGTGFCSGISYDADGDAISSSVGCMSSGSSSVSHCASGYEYDFIKMDQNGVTCPMMVTDLREEDGHWDDDMPSIPNCP